MPADDHLLDDVADAILDGAPIDWAGVESRTDGHRRALLDRLKVLAALADVHHDLPDDVERAGMSRAPRRVPKGRPPMESPQTS